MANRLCRGKQVLIWLIWLIVELNFSDLATLHIWNSGLYIAWPKKVLLCWNFTRSQNTAGLICYLRKKFVKINGFVTFSANRVVGCSCGQHQKGGQKAPPTINISHPFHNLSIYFFSVRQSVSHVNLLKFFEFQGIPWNKDDNWHTKSSFFGFRFLFVEILCFLCKSKSESWRRV